MDGQLKIEEMFAFVVVDTDGTEGIPAMRGPGGMAMPLVGADMARVESLRDVAQQIATHDGVTVTLAKFSVRTDLEVIQP